MSQKYDHAILFQKVYAAAQKNNWFMIPSFYSEDDLWSFWSKKAPARAPLPVLYKKDEKK